MIRQRVVAPLVPLVPLTKRRERVTQRRIPVAAKTAANAVRVARTEPAPAKIASVAIAARAKPRRNPALVARKTAAKVAKAEFAPAKSVNAAAVAVAKNNRNPKSRGRSGTPQSPDNP